MSKSAMSAMQHNSSRNGGYNPSKTRCNFFNKVDLGDVVSPDPPSASHFTATKLIGTLGPSCHDVDTLGAMLESGMAGARVDLTWGPIEFHKQSLDSLNAAMGKTRKLCATIVDILGREVMVRRACTIGEDGWPLHASPISITMGQRVTLTTRTDVEAGPDLLPVTYPDLPSMAEKGDTIYIGRYLVCGADSASLYLNVEEITDTDIICTAQNSAEMDGLMTVFHMERSMDGLQNLQNNLPLLSAYDEAALRELAGSFDIDFLCITYTRTSDDVREARRFLDSIGLKSTRILAKLETRQSLLNIRGILAEADGVVLSRGNLGLDVQPEKMALVQKQIVQTCNLLGKPVLLTRVVDTMVSNPRPTRAEATDIANAVLDGVDGFLLGAETLRGAYPLEVVSTIGQICRVAERVFDYQQHYDYLMESAIEVEMAVAQHKAECRAANGTAPRVTGDSEPSTPTYDGESPGGSTQDLKGMANKGSHVSFAAMQMERQGANVSANSLANAHQNGSTNSFSELDKQIHTFAKYGGAGSRSGYFNTETESTTGRYVPALSKIESLASSAVRAAGKVAADLIIVYTNTGRTAQLVAKYRPPMPIITLVVPRLVNNGMKWRLEGRTTARACQLTRGLLPMLATPGPTSDAVLEAAIVQAAQQGLVKPNGHVIIMQQIATDFAVKIMTLDNTGKSVAKRVSSFGELVKHSLVQPGDELRPTHNYDSDDEVLTQVAPPTPAAVASLVATPVLVNKPPPSGAPGTPEQPVEAPTTPGGAAI